MKEITVQKVIDMNTSEIGSYETILQIVRSWSVPKRFDLVHDVLETLASEVKASHPERPTLPIALGLLATDQPPPSDEEIERWLQKRSIRR